MLGRIESRTDGIHSAGKHGGRKELLDQCQKHHFTGVPSDHDVTREQLRDADAPVPQHAELLAVALKEAKGGPHQVTQLHAPGAVLDRSRFFTSEEEPLKDGRRTDEVSRRKPGGEEKPY